MTDRIDLDQLTEKSDEDAEGNRGDWFWRDDDPADEPLQDPTDVPATNEATAEPAEPGNTNGTSGGAPSRSASDVDATSDGERDTGTTVPHVPRANRDRPVGIPRESGGAGGGAANESPEGATAPAGAAEGPHGGGIDDMTMALTYRAAKRLANPAAAFADASRWTDWFGIVGEVDAHVINKFQRDHSVDADFFNGSGTGPGERLADIDEHSMFYAERMVVVGVEGDDEPIAEVADWEFIPLTEAAAKADWELREAD